MKKLGSLLLIIILLLPVICFAKEMLKLQELRLRQFEHMSDYDKAEIMRQLRIDTMEEHKRMPASDPVLPRKRGISPDRPYEFWDLGTGM